MVLQRTHPASGALSRSKHDHVNHQIWFKSFQMGKINIFIKSNGYFMFDESLLH